MKPTSKQALHHQPNILATFPYVPTDKVRACRHPELISRWKLTEFKPLVGVLEFVHAHACYPRVRPCPSCAVRLRSQSHISWFLLSLTSGGTRSAVGAVWTGGRPEARPGPTPDKHERPDLSANFRAFVFLRPPRVE